MKQLCVASWLGLLLTLPFGVAMAQDTGTGNQSGSFKDVSREARELLESLESYGADQRDEALAASRELLDKLDAQVDAMAENMASNWDEMDAAAREESREAMKALREQQRDLAEWYGGMKHGSADAWDEMKAGFGDAWGSVSDAWGRATEEFEGSR